MLCGLIVKLVFKKFLNYLYYVLKDNIMKFELEEWIDSGYNYPEFEDEP